MRVIPTKYNGLHYRSRAEARWAVVFDQIGWRHQYEPEGFMLPSGAYCPDFYLPDVRAYFEVKGREPTRSEKQKAAELCLFTRVTVVMSSGPPDPDRYEWTEDLHTFEPESADGQDFWVDDHLGGFVSGRRAEHPSCSIHLGNLGYLGAITKIAWRDAFRSAANHRFGVFE